MENIKEKKNHIAFYKSLVFKAGIIVFAALTLSIVIGGQHTYYLVMDDEEKTALKAVEDVSIQLTSGMREDFLDHMLDYWESNYENMDFMSPGEENSREAVKEWAEAHSELWEDFQQEEKFITPDEFSKMSDEDQLLLAEQLYRYENNAIAQVIYDDLGKDVTGYYIFRYIGDDKAFLWFGKNDEEEKETVLGEVVPFTLSKHPVAAEVLETGKLPEKAEHIVSTLDGKEYFYAAWPLVLSGRVKGIIGIMYPWAETKSNLMSRIFQVGGRVLLYMIIADVLLLLLLNRTVLRPVKRVQQRINDYSVNKNSSVVEQGLIRINRKQDEIGALSRDVTDLTKEVDHYVEEIYTLAEEKATVRTELSVATKIQAELLPCTFPAFPDRSEFEIFASMTPAKEVGGDFYDFFLLDDDHLAIVMADVSEKGVPAALFMVVSRTLIKSQTQMCRSPKTILEDVNNKLYECNPEGMFVTVWLGILQISTGNIVACNAGHEYPVLRKADGVFELIKDKHGIFMGAMPDMKYTEYDMQLEKGGCLFLYTDGVPEATDAASELFGTDRMLEALNKEPQASPEDLLSNVKEAVDDFVKDAPQFDDITMLAITLRGDG